MQRTAAGVVASLWAALAALNRLRGPFSAATGQLARCRRRRCRSFRALRVPSSCPPFDGAGKPRRGTAPGDCNQPGCTRIAVPWLLVPPGRRLLPRGLACARCCWSWLLLHGWKVAWGYGLQVGACSKIDRSLKGTAELTLPLTKRHCGQLNLAILLHCTACFRYCYTRTSTRLGPLLLTAALTRTGCR